MPPRARKTAAAAPDDQQAPASTGTEEQPAPASDGIKQPETEPTASPAEILHEPTYHWESVNGDGSEPCRHCPPGAPPAGAGSYGCPHGQWVRVQDGAD